MLCSRWEKLDFEERTICFHFFVDPFPIVLPFLLCLTDRQTAHSAVIGFGHCGRTKQVECCCLFFLLPQLLNGTHSICLSRRHLLVVVASSAANLHKTEHVYNVQTFRHMHSCPESKWREKGKKATGSGVAALEQWSSSAHDPNQQIASQLMCVCTLPYCSLASSSLFRSLSLTFLCHLPPLHNAFRMCVKGRLWLTGATGSINSSVVVVMVMVVVVPGGAGEGGAERTVCLSSSVCSACVYS